MANKNFKKLCVVFLVAMLAVCIFCINAAADTVYTVTSPCSLKSHPNPGSDDNIWVPSGSSITMLGKQEGEWYWASFQGHNGWIKSDCFSAVNTDATGTTSTWKSAGYNTTTTGGGLQLRTSPGTQYPAIASIPLGSTVYLHSYGNGWAYVSYNGTWGYVSSTYLAATGGNSGGSSASSQKASNFYDTAYNVNTYTTTNGNVNLRSVPTTVGNEPLTWIPAGQTVYLVEYRNGWSHVYWGSQWDGWVSNSYLSYFGGGSTPAPAPAPTPSDPNAGLIDGGSAKPTESGWYDCNNTMTVTGQGVRLRSGPGTQYTILTTMPAGAQVIMRSYDSYNRGWAYVYWGSQWVGYCSTMYLK